MKKINLFTVALLAFVLVFSSQNLSYAATTSTAKSSSQSQSSGKSKSGSTTQNTKKAVQPTTTSKKSPEKVADNQKSTPAKSTEKSTEKPAPAAKSTQNSQRSSGSKRVNSSPEADDENFAESNLTADDWKIEVNDSKGGGDDFSFIKNDSASFGFFNNAPLVFSVSFALIALAVAGIVIFSVLYIKNSPIRSAKKPSKGKHKAAHFRVF